MVKCESEVYLMKAKLILKNNLVRLNPTVLITVLKNLDEAINASFEEFVELKRYNKLDNNSNSKISKSNNNDNKLKLIKIIQKYIKTKYDLDYTANISEIKDLIKFKTSSRTELKMNKKIILCDDNFDKIENITIERVRKLYKITNIFILCIRDLSKIKF